MGKWRGRALGARRAGGAYATPPAMLTMGVLAMGVLATAYSLWLWLWRAMSKATQPARFQSAQCFSRCSVARTVAAKSAPGQGQESGSVVSGKGQAQGSGSGSGVRLRLSGQWSVVSGQWSVVSGQWSVSVSGLGRGEARAVGRRGREQVVGARLHLFDLSALRREELVLRCGSLQEHQDLDEHVAPEVDIAQL